MSNEGLAVRQSDGLSERMEESGELAAVKGSAEIVAAIQAAMVVAKRFPRDEVAALTRLTRSCQRTSFAEDAMYSFPRGGTQVEGPSVKLAREAARCWGNIEHRTEIVRDSEESRQVRVWAWDLETNTRHSAEDTFTKRVYRKSRDGKGGAWVDISGDEREMRELTNRRAAVLERNCILKLLPSDVVEEAMKAVRKTLSNQAAQDPDGQRKAIALAFANIGVPPEEVAKYLDKPLAQANPQEIANLKTIYTSIKDGNSRWSEYVPKEGEAKPIATPKATKSTVEQEANSLVAEIEAATAKIKATAEAKAARQPGDDEGEESGAPMNGSEPESESEQKPTVECSEKQIRLLFAIGKGARMSGQDVKALCREKYGCDIDAITRADFNRFLEVLKTRGQANG